MKRADGSFGKESGGTGREGRDRSGARGRLRRAARSLRQYLAGARDDLGHIKHRQRWLWMRLCG